MLLASVLFPFVLQNIKLKDMLFLRAARALRAAFASKQNIEYGVDLQLLSEWPSEGRDTEY